MVASPPREAAGHRRDFQGASWALMSRPCNPNLDRTL
jgi:hypothetical protein